MTNHELKFTQDVIYSDLFKPVYVKNQRLVCTCGEEIPLKMPASPETRLLQELNHKLDVLLQGSNQDIQFRLDSPK